MGVFHLFFGFSGRINRAKFWWTLVAWLVIWLIALLVIFVSALAILGVNITDGELPSPKDPNFVRIILDYAVLVGIVAAFHIVGLISSFAIGVKRLHDRDKSGWWILLFYVGPSVLGAAANGTDGELASAILSLASLALTIWMVVELGFLRGTVGSNRFGPDPLQRDAATAPAVGASKPAA